MDLDFNTIFKIPVAAMRINRTHPDIPRDKKWLLEFTLMHGVATFVAYLVAYSTILHDCKNKNFTQASENLIIIFLYLIGSSCYFMMLWSQKSLVYLINTMQRNFDAAKNLPAAEQRMLFEYADRGRWMCKLWVFISCTVATIFPMRSLCFMVYYTITDEFRMVPIYDLTIYPGILEENRDDLLTFVLLWIAMLWLCMYASTIYIGLVPLGHIFMLHACGQIELLKNRAKSLFPEHHYNSKQTQDGLKSIIKSMQDIYRFVDHIQLSFRLIYELCLKGTIITMPLLIYELGENAKQGEFNVEFFAITIGSIVISSIPCYHSDLLMELSFSLRQTLYTSGWERHWDKQVRSTLLIILIRTGRPTAVQSMFGNMSLSALGNVYHHSYAIYSLINAIW